MATAELGSALRHWRDRVPPQSVGWPTGERRRTTGLRCEELSQLTGISADYIVRLEQGRAANPSAQIVEALAHALQLGPSERSHPFRGGDDDVNGRRVSVTVRRGRRPAGLSRRERSVVWGQQGPEEVVALG